jgi:hypothetical protein
VSDQSVPPPPDDGGVPSWVDQDKAQSEEKNWPNEALLKQQKHANDLLWLKCYGWLVVGLTFLFCILFVSSLCAWSWHYLAPAAYHWLTADQLSKIQSVVFSGSLGAIVTSILKKQIDK